MKKLIGKSISKIGDKLFDVFWEKAAYEWCYLNPIGKIGFKLVCLGNRIQGLNLYKKQGP